MNVLIIDDDLLFCIELKNKIADLFKNYSLPTHIDICHKDFQNIDFYKYDLYLLDIMLPKNNGIELGERILKENDRTILVFMSIDDNNVFDTFPLDHFYYIRKSSIDSDLEKFMKKFSQKFETISFVSHYQKIQIFQKDIIMIESKRNKLSITTIDNKYSVYDSLSHFLQQLNHHCFYRLHSYCIINLRHVQSFQNKSVILSQNHEIFYGRKKEKLKEAYMNYKRNDL